MRGQGRPHNQVLEAVSIHVHSLKAGPEVFSELAAAQGLQDGDGLLVLIPGTVQGAGLYNVNLSCPSLAGPGSSNYKLTSPTSRIKITFKD